jgi:DNA-binding transcriptional ArsR family regulator
VNAHAVRAGVVFAALADSTRRRVVEELAVRGEATATQLAGDLPVSRQAVSKHLAQLLDARMVEAVRDGREVRYRLDTQPLTSAMAWMNAVGSAWDRRLAALERHARSVRPRR